MSDSITLLGVRLYRREIDQLIELIGKYSSVSISSQNEAFVSIDDMKVHEGDVLNDLALTSAYGSPHFGSITVMLGIAGVFLFTASSSDDERTHTHFLSVKEFLEKHYRPVTAFPKNVLYCGCVLFVFGVLCIFDRWGWVSPEPKSLWFLVASLLIGWLIAFRIRHTCLIALVPKAEHRKSTLFHRARERTVDAIVSNGVGYVLSGIVGYMLAKAL